MAERYRCQNDDTMCQNGISSHPEWHAVPFRSQQETFCFPYGTESGDERWLFGNILITITFPLECTPTFPQQKGSLVSFPSPKPIAPPVAGGTILVISHAGESTPWTTLLTERGFHILHARGQEEAVLLFTREPSITVVTVDMDTDHYDAAAIIERLRDLERERDGVEYLLIAENGAPLAALQTVVSRISDILIKPGDPMQFADAVCDAVNVARMKHFQREEAHALEASLADFKMRTHVAISHLITQAQGACNITPAPPAPASVLPDSEALQSFITEESDRARLREKVFGPLVQNHAVWILLLVLWDAGQAGTELTIKSAAYAAGLPLSSALRKINDMCAEGLIVRRDDPDDARRSFVALTSQGRGYFIRFFSIWDGAHDNRRASAG